MPPNANYHNPPVDANLYFSNNQSVTADAASTSKYDSKGANCFPKNAVLVIQPVTLGAGEELAISLRQDSDSGMGSPTTILTLTNLTASTTTPTIIPLSNVTLTERYVDLYYDCTSGDTIPVTAFLSIAG